MIRRDHARLGDFPADAFEMGESYRPCRLLGNAGVDSCEVQVRDRRRQMVRATMGSVIASDLFEGRTFNTAAMALSVLGVLVAVVTWVYTRRATLPVKRKLLIVEIQPTSLLRSASQSVSGIAVTHNGQVLQDPYLATVNLVNVGRHAISSDHFDRQRPIILDFGVPIIEVVRAGQVNADGGSIEHVVDGTKIRIGPDLLTSKSRFSIQSLTQGRPSLAPVEHHLIDTTFEQRREESDSFLIIGWRTVLTALAISIVTLAVGGFINLTVIILS